MSDPANNPFDLLLEQIREVVLQEIRAANGNGQSTALLTPEELASRMNIPVSWVYEQSRQGEITTHRVGRYIRFAEHLKTSKKKGGDLHGLHQKMARLMGGRLA
jgi:excisionase family DNA binding protein